MTRTAWLALAASLLAIGATLAAGGLLLAARHFYAQSKLAPVEPVQLTRYAAANAALPVPGTRPRLVLIGDSRIADWPAAAAPPGWEVVNRGIGGETVAQLLLRLEQDALSLRPTAVLIQAGVNDLVAAGLAGPASGAAIAERTAARLQDAASRITVAGARVILLTIIPPGDVGLARRPFWSEATRRHVATVNATLLAWTPPSGVTVLDTARALGASDRLPPQWQTDTLHLTNEAYARLAAMLELGR